MNLLTQSPNALEANFKCHPSVSSSSSTDQVILLQGILEGMPDGLLIVSDEGNVIVSNTLGRHLCEQLIDRPVSVDSVPPLVWRLCEALIDSRETFADSASSEHFVLEGDICTCQSGVIRVRVQWFTPDSPNSRILVILEDRYRTAQNRAIAEGKRYGLTRRESEVWFYRCVGHTYKQIADELFISVDTVKKHVKSIHAKRDTFQYFNDEEDI